MTKDPYQSLEPTKTCTKCGEAKDRSMFDLNRKSNNRVILRTVCKVCSAKAKREHMAKKRELERLHAQSIKDQIDRSTIAKPRTFNHLKDGECWTGHTERQYIRNEGLKHILSKGV